jgi:hypothetical protein
MRYAILIIVGLLGIVSCKKEIIPDEPPYIEQWWDEYYGTYTVFDTLNDVTYEMEIKQIERYHEGILTSDSVFVHNVANRFDSKTLYIQNITNLGGLGLEIYNPIKDGSNRRWAFSFAFLKKDNSDTLELRYTLSNIAYYMEDGVPYYACECVDLAVKNE